MPPVALTDVFAGDDAKAKQWGAFCKRSGLEDRVGELAAVVAELSGFLLPVIAAAQGDQAFASKWVANGPWA